MTLDAANPFAAESLLPHRLPPFAAIRTEHFAPALAAGMVDHEAEVAAIATNPEPADFHNTVLALERSGRLLTRVLNTFWNLTSSDATAQLQAIEAQWAPRITAHYDAILLDADLFARVATVHAGRAELTPEDRALTERIHTDFVLAGAGLEAAGRASLAALNLRLAELSTQFQQNLLADTDARALVLDSADQLAGAGSDAIAAATSAALDRGLPGKYVISLVLPTNQPLLAVLEDRDVRRRLFEASIRRCRSGRHANLELAAEIARLRAQRAALLGFANHAGVAMADQTAKNPAAVDAMLAQLVEPAMRNALGEAELLRAAAAADRIDLAPWDWAFYSARLARERFDLDTEALRPYFELGRVLDDGVFHAAELLYGLTFHPRPDLLGYHPDVRIWEVFDADEMSIGLYLGDFFARPIKRGGAWMSNFVEQNHLFGERPVVVNCLNLNKPPAPEPTLLTLDQVRTLFHEFGHALHGLLSDVSYSRISGTNVPRDFVEYPSQVNEMWLRDPGVLANYARHHATGEPLAPEQLQRIQAAQQWGQGFATVEFLAATLLDQAWHRLGAGDEVGDPLAFERRALAEAGVANDLIPPRYGTPYFQHVFAGGYAASYYGYVWAEVLDADTVDWFLANGGATRANGERFRRTVLAVGGSVDPIESFESLVGHAPDIVPLLRRRGLQRD